MIGGANGDHMEGGAGNDVFIQIDNADLQDKDGWIDGGAGDDRVGMHLLSNFNANSSDNDDAHIRNVEILDFEGDQKPNTAALDGTTISLDAESVLDMTDNDHVLFIQGDTEDTLSMLNANGSNWSSDGLTYQGSDGRDYTLYTSTVNGSEVKVYVDQDITIVP